MSTVTTTHHRFPGSAGGAAIACALVIGGVSALGVALSQDHTAQPASPSVECTSASCVGPDHPVLRGRHDHGKFAHGRLHPTTGGGHTVVGQP